MSRNLTFIVLVITLSCQAQHPILKELTSEQKEMNYFLSQLYDEPPKVAFLYDEGIRVTLIRFSDPNSTPETISSETESFVDSYLVSIAPDGDYYTSSKLYKLEGFINPEIKEITSAAYPVVLISIEHGPAEKRKTQTFSLKGP